MKNGFVKNNLHIFSLILLLGLILLPQVAAAQGWGDSIVSKIGGGFLDGLLFIPGWLSIIILQILSLVLYLSGTILNFVIDYTVVDMADNIGKAGINNVWSTIRDIANMGFIFVLLYASIQLILGVGGSAQQTIRNVVIAAILINFSLFFTKVVIDASNVLAITLYGAMAPNALNGTEAINSGLANNIMDLLNVQTIAKEVSTLDGTKAITVGVLGSVFVLVAAFVFFAISIMFVIRFVALIFVLILSPIAFIAMILPQLKSQASKWKDALIGQAFFAPIFFLLIWVAISVAQGLFSADGNQSLGRVLTGSVGEGGGVKPPEPGDIGLVVNFLVVIALLIAALMTAKEWANKAGPVASAATKWLTGAAGNAVYGGVGLAGRKTLGWYGSKAAADVSLQERAAKQKGFAGMSARLGLGVAKKMRSGSFDARRAVIPGRAIGEAIEGTVGRTAIGRRMGLDDVNVLQNAEIGAFAAGQAGVGQGREGGYVERQQEKKKRIQERQKIRTDEARQVGHEADIADNIPDMAEYDRLQSAAAAAGGAHNLPPQDQQRLAELQPKADSLEKAIGNSTTKEIEAIVGSNRELLKSQEFANRISVQQLEAIIKSDQFSEDEKQGLKDNRFASINAAVAAGNPANARGAIRGLSDSELEMIDPSHFSDAGFVSQMRPAQIEAVNKSSRFTSSQKAALRTSRRQPLFNALDTGDVSAAKTAVRELGHKEIAALDMAKLTDSTMLQVYTPQILKRLAPEMNPADVPTLKNAIISMSTIPGVVADPQLFETAAWLQTPDGAIFS